MAISKNKGPLLTSKLRGGVDDFPKEFLALVGVDLLVQEVPLDIDPDPIIGLLIDSKVEHTRTNERKKTNTYLTEFPDDLPDETFIASTGQVGQHARELVPEGTDLIVDALTESADQHNLGNGWLDQNIVSVDEVFPHRISSLNRRDVTPPEFNALLPVGRLEYIDDTPFDYITSLDPGVLTQEAEETTEFRTKHDSTFRNLLDLPAQIIDSDTNEFKQVLFINKTLDVEATLPPTPTSTTKVSWTHLGDGTAVTRVEGPEDLFDQHTFARERPDIAPQWAVALLPIFEESLLEEGVAVDPDPLASGVYLKREQQEDEFNRRVTTRSRDLLALPVQRVNKNTNRYKQVETITEILEDDGTVPASPTALQDVVFEILGDGSATERRTAVPSLFTENLFERSVPDITPEWAKALLQTEHQEENVTGTAADPTLLPGDLSRSERQYDVFNKRTSRVFRDLASLPTQRVNYRTNRFKQVETVTDILEDDATTPDVPTALQDVTFEVLGDGTATEQHVEIDDIFDQQVYEESRPEVWPERFRALVPLSTDRHREIGTAAPPTLTTGDVRKAEQQEDEFIKLVETATRDLPSLPTSLLYGQRYEDTFDLVIPYSEWVDTAGTNLGDPRKVVTPQGDGTEQVEELDFTSVAAALDAYSLVFPGTTNLNNKLPDVLTDLTAVFEVNSGNGSYSETGAGYWSVRGSYSLSIRGSGNGSAAVVADATFLLTPPFKPSAPTKRVVFFLPNPVSISDVTTKLSTILGTTVNDWPDFDPSPVTVVCTSRKVSVRAEANQHTQSGGGGIGGDTGCDAFDCVSCDAASTTGTGTSTEVGITIKTIRIPACLHGAINLHDSQNESATAQAYAYDGSSWGSCVPPEFGPADTGLLTLTAIGNVDSDASATSETGYPSGDYLLETSAQPYKYGYAIIHAEVVTL